MSLPLQEFFLRITPRRIFFNDKFAYPWYQRFFLPCDEELRRLQADTSSAFGRRHNRRNWKPHMKSLWHPAGRVKLPLKEFFLGNCRPAIQLA